MCIWYVILLQPQLRCLAVVVVFLVVRLVLHQREAGLGAEAVADTVLQLLRIAAVAVEPRDLVAAGSLVAPQVPFVVAGSEIDRVAWYE